MTAYRIVFLAYLAVALVVVGFILSWLVPMLGAYSQAVE